MAARRPARVRVPEAPLPRAQRVRADVQQRRRLAGLERAHQSSKGMTVVDVEAGRRRRPVDVVERQRLECQRDLA